MISCDPTKSLCLQNFMYKPHNCTVIHRFVYLACPLTENSAFMEVVVNIIQVNHYRKKHTY